MPVVSHASDGISNPVLHFFRELNQEKVLVAAWEEGFALWVSSPSQQRDGSLLKAVTDWSAPRTRSTDVESLEGLGDQPASQCVLHLVTSPAVLPGAANEYWAPCITQSALSALDKSQGPLKKPIHMGRKSLCKSLPRYKINWIPTSKTASGNKL